MGNDAYTFAVYHVNYGFYPIVQAYVRTFDQNREPLVNVNVANIGIMVQGKLYDPAKFDPSIRKMQYAIESLESRGEGFRTVFVWDCSGTMQGKPFEDTKTAILKFVEAKRPADQIAVIAVRDTNEGYQIVSQFEKDPTLLYQRMGDVKCDGQKTRLYDSIAAAIEMCATASQGDVNNAGGEFAILQSIVCVSDGKDEGSAIQRAELIGRIGQLKTPIPVYSVAYSKVDKDNFSNLEAISKATFGRYWTAVDSQEFATITQKIHRINRSDYVVSFRSYVPVDGSRVNFKIGVSYPSNTGRFLYRDGEFEAIQSPAPLNSRAKEYWETLQAQYPPVPGNNPYMDAPGTPPAAQAAPPKPSQSQPAPLSSSTVQPVPSEDKTVEPAAIQEKVIGFVKQNPALAGMGAGLVILALSAILWTRTSATPGPYAVNTVPRTTGLRGSGAGTPLPEPTQHGSLGKRDE